VFTVSDRLTVGRAAPCGLRLADPKVSRRHATLAIDNGTLTVRDEASLNGTWVNDRRIAGTAALRAGDRLRIGGSEFIVAGADGAGDAFPADLEELLVPVAGEAVLAGSGTFVATPGDGQGL
jgi:pSer/pThr/pTyr-binding forkhead associated (FHA) protein